MHVTEEENDLPYGENFHDAAEAAAWAQAASRKRPWRPMIFDHFVAALTATDISAPRVLELGAGPGFLAEHVLDRCPALERYTLLDFSGAMLAQSRARLVRHAVRTELYKGRFQECRLACRSRRPVRFRLLTPSGA